MDTQPISNCCPKCHSPLPADAPQGLCPKCLFAAVATPTEAGQPAGHRATPPPLEEIAAAFPQLEILEFIGQGGMGFVFKARQPKLDRLVALKILPQSLAADPTFAERFNREARLLAHLNHPGIVTVHDFGVTSPQPFYYLLMEFVDGVNLRQAMQAGRFTPDQALAIVPKICEALQFAHNEGVLHRDIKPENILLDAKGRVKIADFGIAKLTERGSATRSTPDSPEPPSLILPPLNPDVQTALTETGKTLGTPNYMAPEQLERPQDVDHRADIYSLGVVFYEMLTGELPLGRFAPPSQKSAADPRVDQVVLRALEKEKGKRYASADEVKTQVETIATQRHEGNQPTATSRGNTRHFLRWLMAGAAGVVVAILCLAHLLQPRTNNLDNQTLATRPDKLRTLPTDKVIQVGLEKPELPWAWQELEKRAQAGDFHSGEATKILNGLTTWMRREHPQGYNHPLFSIGDLINGLNQPYFVDETNVLEFLSACCGTSSIEPLARIRENATILHLLCKWRSPWFNQQSLGFELLNEMRSISVDGRQIPVRNGSRENWNEWQYNGQLALPKLTPGKHVVRCEVDSALVATSEMAGLAKNAGSKDWPPAKRRWTRVSEAEFTVYPADADIVSLTDDPNANPVAGGALSATQIIIRSESGRLTATACFNVSHKPEQPISVDVTLRVAGQTIKCRNLFAVASTNRSAVSDTELTAEIEPLDPQIKEAELVLTPNPKIVEEYPYVDRLWGKEIVISHVPLSRQDLYGTKRRDQPVVQTNTASTFPDRDYFVIYAWDVSYNLTTNIASLESRWQLLNYAIAKLRDEGLAKFPTDVAIHRELGWLFAHRLGLQKPIDNPSLTYVADQTYFRYQWARQFEQAQAQGQLQSRLKLDPALMKSVDEQYGPLEWRLPESHAIYWAAHRLNSKPAPEKDDLILQRVISQSLQASFQRGKLVGEPSPTEMRLERNLRLASKVNASYEREISDNASDPQMQAHIAVGHRNFLRDAVVALYENGQLMEANSFYDKLGKLYPRKPLLYSDTNSFPNLLTCEEFVRRQKNEQ